MKKPTEEMIKSATDQQLAEWSAMYLKGWHSETLPVARYGCYKHWFNEENELICAECEWNPAQNIGQAVELLEKFADKEWILIEKFPLENHWTTRIGTSSDRSGWVRNGKLSRAITIAALLAVREDKK